MLHVDLKTAERKRSLPRKLNAQSQPIGIRIIAIPSYGQNALLERRDDANHGVFIPVIAPMEQIAQQKQTIRVFAEQGILQPLATGQGTMDIRNDEVFHENIIRLRPSPLE